ncbi:hypothetical protein CF386_00400 [Paraphotobacterium marinum]|uniref:Card1 endonuclease domain-containing protein n=2 Tax=Paraphotobacterium marinum TaxID=1755811 RepID=A0A220VBD2_9GAMM|nr:hypothetical protein CF386_00400 [Paraphotobacterium marinum]
MMNIHIGVLDSDPIRLITPILDSHLKITKLILFGKHNNKGLYERIKSLLEPKVMVCFLDLSTSTNFFEFYELHLFSILQLENSSVFFNASCGHRKYILPLYEFCVIHKIQTYYIDEYSDDLIWINNPKKKHYQIADKINIPQFLHIFNLQSLQSDSINFEDKYRGIKDIHQKWVKNAKYLAPGFATLNYLATTCRKTQSLTIELTPKQQGYKELSEILTDLSLFKLIDYENGVLSFKNEESRKYANGEWIENFIFNIILDLKSQLSTIQDVCYNLEIHRNLNDRIIKNELDIVVIVNNKLHIIECKTKDMRSGDDTLYKLESLREFFGGIQSRAMLLSYREVRNYDLSRADDLNIKIIGPNDFHCIKKEILSWFKEAGGH